MATGKQTKRTQQDLSKLKSLGEQVTNAPGQYSPDILESIEHRHKDKDQWVSFICPEFTSMCPKTGQPDFAKIVINYVPHRKIVESKSLKLYLFSFRNEGEFHEDCTQRICDDLFQLLKPRFIEVLGQFTPRGGIALWPYSSMSQKAEKYAELKRRRWESYSPGSFSLNLGAPYS